MSPRCGDYGVFSGSSRPTFNGVYTELSLTKHTRLFIVFIDTKYDDYKAAIV